MCRGHAGQGRSLLSHLLEQLGADQARYAAPELARQPLADRSCQLCGRHRRRRTGCCRDNAPGRRQDANTGDPIASCSVCTANDCLVKRSCSGYSVYCSVKCAYDCKLPVSPLVRQADAGLRMKLTHEMGKSVFHDPLISTLQSGHFASVNFVQGK